MTMVLAVMAVAFDAMQGCIEVLDAVTLLGVMSIRRLQRVLTMAVAVVMFPFRRLRDSQGKVFVLVKALPKVVLKLVP